MRFPILRRLTAATATLVLGLTAGLAVATPAAAAPPYDSTAEITSLSFTETRVQDHRGAKLEGTWRLADDPTGSSGFSLTLPAGLDGHSGGFSLYTEPDQQGEVMGECTVTARTLYCDLDADYLRTNPRNIHGTFEFWVEVRTNVTTEERQTFSFEEVEGDVSVIIVPSGQCTENCEYTGNSSQKYGNYQYDDEGIVWVIDIAAPQGGMVGGELITVTDNLQANQTLSTRDDAVFVQETTHLITSPGGEQWPHYDRNSMDQSDVTVDRTGVTASWTAKPGAYYRIFIRVDTTDRGASGTYENIATVAIEGSETVTVPADVVRSGGGGTGIGENIGQFSITKAVTGTAEIPEDRTFTVEYTVTPPGGDPISDSTSIRAGETFTSAEYPRGSAVRLTEVAPEGSAAISWEAPDFSLDEFTLPGGELTEITLTNEANLNLGSFEASKTLVDPADLVDPSSEFLLSYTYPAGDGFPAGSGVLRLPADGSTVTSEDLPIGAVLSLAEAAPAEVLGGTWGPSAINPSTVTIGAEDAVSVTVTNTITPDVGAFSITKSLSGTGVSRVPEGTVFTVTYSYPAGEGFPAGSGEVEVRAGETVTVGGLPAGAEVTLTEVSAVDPEGATWGEPVFDHSTFTIVRDGLMAVDLDNPIDLGSGSFSVLKAVEGDGADLVNPDREFTVEYSYPAGEGFPAGEGTLIVRADGSAVTSGQLPYGAVVTLSEAAPAAVAGGTWTGAQFSASELTIGDGTTVAVDLVNTIDEEPPPPAEEEPPPGQQTPPPNTPAEAPPTAGTTPLPRTGSEISGALDLAVVLLMAGAAAMLGSRRKRGEALN